MNNKINDKVKKNLLDLEYNKYLQYYNTSIIILFTYFIGVAIALITNQVNYKNFNQLFLVAIISIAIVSTIIILMLRWKSYLKDIPNKIENLKL